MYQQNKPKESDWKQFRKMVPELRERYIEEHLPSFMEILNDKNRTPTRRFWDTFEKMDETGKILRDCLDGHSRSKMFMFMSLMYRYGMLKEEDLSHFSEELQSRLHSLKEMWEE